MKRPFFSLQYNVSSVSRGGRKKGALSERYCTCFDCLPTYGERIPCLDNVVGDGAVVVRPRDPGELGGRVGDLTHDHALGSARGP